MNSRKPQQADERGMNRLPCLHTVWLCVLLALPIIGCADDPRPNIVFILIDDMGWTDAGAFGSPFYETPHIDQLAAQGLLFTSAYAASPVCSPTRVSILTGRNPARLHVTDWLTGRADRPDQQLLQVEDLDALPLEEVTLGEALREAGYVTAHIGKWHVGGGAHLPEGQGFDVNIAGTEYGSPPGYFWPYRSNRYSLMQLAEDGQEGEYLTDRLSEEAARFITANRDRPFFLHFSHYAVHTPLQAKDTLAEHYQAKAEALAVPEDSVWGLESGHKHRRVQNHAVYAAMVQSMDESVGRVMQALDDNGLADRTFVFFFSDNGGLATSEGWPTTNLPLRAGKGWLYEGGLRVPMIVRGPEVRGPGRTIDVPLISDDFFPTIMELTGVTPTTHGPLDGTSFAHLLRGSDAPHREMLYWHYPHYSNQGGRPGGAIRAGPYKLIEFFEDSTVVLFNLDEDLGEQHDLAADLPERADSLRQRLHAWRAALNAQMPTPNPDYTAPERPPPRPGPPDGL